MTNKFQSVKHKGKKPKLLLTGNGIVYKVKCTKLTNRISRTI